MKLWIKPLIGKGVFSVLEDKDFFMNRCTILNRTLAWDLSGEYDPTDCLDLDSVVLYSEQNWFVFLRSIGVFC